MQIEGVCDNYSDRGDDFFKRLDGAGGWPASYKYASFYHSISMSNRTVEFGNEYMRTGWWTTRYESDDYYWWKISESKKQEIRKKFGKELVSKIRDLVRT